MLITFVAVALSSLPNFTALPNGPDNAPLPHHQTTIHINNESMQTIQDAYVDYMAGRYSKKLVEKLFRGITHYLHHVEKLKK